MITTITINEIANSVFGLGRVLNPSSFNEVEAELQFEIGELYKNGDIDLDQYRDLMNKATDHAALLTN